MSGDAVSELELSEMYLFIVSVVFFSAAAAPGAASYSQPGKRI